MLPQYGHDVRLAVGQSESVSDRRSGETEAWSRHLDHERQRNSRLEHVALGGFLDSIPGRPVVLREPPPVTYCIKAVQYPALSPFAIRLFITNGLPSYVDLGWEAFDFMTFHLEYSETLSPPIWQPFTINGTTPLVFGPQGNFRIITSFWHRDDGSLTPPGLPATNRFYRLRILP